ncbi:MAG: DUF2207 domain-containing protein [Bacilli bacterium]|nr:DUF2207 domain-containing protein [Bacilli bacterium]
MKKILLFLTLMFIPFSVTAKENITNYYIDATILKNGDVKVRELIVVEGKFDTFNYFLKYPSSTDKIFDDSIESYIDSSIYDADDVSLQNVKIIEIDEFLNFDYINQEAPALKKVSKDADLKGRNDIYTTNKKKDGLEVTIYSSTINNRKGFYIEYTIYDVVVLHNDVGEVKLDIFTKGHRDIKNLEMVINIPNNLEILEKWTHGPISGNIIMTDKEEIRIFVNEVDAKDPFSIRTAFDTEVSSESSKLTNKDALDKITEAELIIEEQEIESMRLEKLRHQIGKITLEVLSVLWLFGMIGFFIKVYFKHDREYHGKYKSEYYKSIPDNYTPAIVGYLMYKSVDDNDFVASVCSLIERKIIKVKKVKDDNYLLSWTKTKDLMETDKKIIELIFGAEKDIDIANIKTNAINNKTKFLQKYNNWYVHSTIEAEKQKLYESTPKVKVKMVIYSIIGLVIALLSLLLPIDLFIFNVISITSIIGIVYFSTFKKKTVKGANKHSKWNAFKRYLKDFEVMEMEELPDINLWEKYLVYATTFGFNEKLYKVMKEKVIEYDRNHKANNQDMLDKLSIYQMVSKETKSAIKHAHTN